jgi:hypothetical protein
MIELTITQNGALYAVQDGARNDPGKMYKVWLHANAIIRTVGRRFWLVRKIKTNEVCFI